MLVVQNGEPNAPPNWSAFHRDSRTPQYTHTQNWFTAHILNRRPHSGLHRDSNTAEYIVLMLHYPLL